MARNSTTITSAKFSNESKGVDQQEYPIIYSFATLKVNIDRNVFDYLACQYSEAAAAGRDHMYRMLDQMKVAPKITYGRVNFLQASPHEVKEELEKALGCSKDIIHFHPQYFDCISIPPLQTTATTSYLTSHFTRKNAASTTSLSWPKHQRCVLVDRYCGEAVLRGAHIYVRGVLCADFGIQPEELVAVSLYVVVAVYRGTAHHSLGCKIVMPKRYHKRRSKGNTLFHCLSVFST
jgi:hypothetical protein